MIRILKYIINLFASILFVLFQQGLIVFIGLVVYDQHGELGGYLTWSLCLPMLYLNYLTFKFVFKYGLIDFMTINARTDEIDVPKDKKIWP